MSNASRHIPFERLADLVEERLAADERTPVLTHLAACARCAAEMRWLAGVMATMRGDDTEDAPVHVIARAVRLIRPPAAATRPGPLRRVLASLSFDSAGMQPAMGVRSEASGARQMLFSAAGYDVDLRAARSGTRWTVAGQVLGPGEGGTIVLEGAAGTVPAQVNELREFTLPPVEPGAYTLRLALADVEIEVPGLVLDR